MAVTDAGGRTRVVAPKAVGQLGVADEKGWSQSPRYALCGFGQAIEPAEVQFAWNDAFFFARYTCTDSDIVQQAEQDQMLHYRYGDVVELFLKADDHPWYWEYYATPRAQRTALYHRGVGPPDLDACLAYRSNLRVEVVCNGTINDSSDEDRGWTAQIAVPIEEFAAAGSPLTQGTAWTVLASRYNHRQDLKNPELSAFPRLSQARFHTLAEWGRLELGAG